MIFSYLLTLFGVCGLAVGTLVVLRAAKSGGLSIGAAQPIRLVGRQAVGSGSSLMLVEVDGRRMLIGVSRSGIAVLETKSSEKESFGLRLSKPCSSSASSHPRRTTLRQAQGERAGESFSATLRRAGERW